MTTRDLLIEIGCEELPPKALRQLNESLAGQIAAGLESLELPFSGVERYATPRRLAVIVRDLADAQPDREQERLGPAVAAAFDDNGEPRPAATGFAKSCGTTVDQLERVQTDKGERLRYVVKQKGKSVADLIGDLLRGAVKKLPIPKPMRWGDSDEQFIRPVHWLVVLYGDQVLDTELLGQRAGNVSRGHRFMSEGPINLTQVDDYLPALKKNHVIADFDDRKAEISRQVRALGEKLGGVAQISPELLEEVGGLVEWPVALAGKFDEEFLDVPAEALVSSMAEHQKYFHVMTEGGELLPGFITVSNIESNNPQSVISGNEKVIRPRLADAKFFFDTDRKQTLASRVGKLEKVVFQKQLGSIQDKARRVAIIAKKIAGALGADESRVARAAELSKCDLATDMVGEFPDLQGIMGGYYARHDGEAEAVAIALQEQYLPRFSGDDLAADPVGQALAIADRVDTLVGIFGIGQPPGGAKDPFALRRAAIGLIRTLVEKQLPLDLADLIDWALPAFEDRLTNADVKDDLLEFILERVRAWYQEQGIETDLINAVMALKPTTPIDFDARIRAMQFFRTLPEAEALAAANKRVKNILAKSDGVEPGNIDDSLLVEAEEKELANWIRGMKQDVANKAGARDYQAVLEMLAGLKTPVDNFFDAVMVNADDEQIRNNRLALLAELRALFQTVADISLLQAS